MSQTDTPSAGLTRRSLLTGTARAAGAAAFLTVARAALPGGGAWAAAAPEVTGATLGFIALTDSAPLIVAKVKGVFAKYGMPDVNVVKQASWGTTRDNLELGGAAGGIDGAHILTPMPYLMSAGKITKNNQPLPMALLARLNTNGQAISVGARYKELGITTKAKGLKEAFAKQKAEGKEVKCAVTFPGGTHDLWMRYWLASNGIDPDKDVSTIVVPPPQMVANMKVDTMEAFCVGEPWNAQLVNQGIGFTALTTGELWHDHPEKSFAMRADWVDKNPNAAKALLAAIIEAQIWCDKPENKEEMCQIVSGREWFKVPVEDILGRATGTIDYGDGRVVKNSPEIMKYWSNHASYPYPSHDLWFLTEDQRWGYLPGDLDTKALIAKVNRQDLWRDAAKVAGATDLPAGTSRGIEKFFDGRTFDPANPAAYLASHDIKRIA